MRKEEETQKEQPRILVVDDDLILRQFMATVLLSCGYTCVCAEDGLAAIEMLAKKNFDMVISDIEMPRMNGFELLSHIKNSYPETKIIMISGKQRPNDVKGHLSLEDAHHFLPKPFTVNLFLSAVDTILSRP